MSGARHSAISFAETGDFCLAAPGRRLRPKPSASAVFGKSTDPETNVKIVFSRRDPAAPLENPALLLVAMYAWDGNS